jgi:hypothetical protein
MSSNKHITITPVAKAVPFDNSTNGFVASDVQAAIEEVKSSASPGFSFGRTGTTSGGTYLQNETVPSNIAGRWVFINDAVVTNVFVSNESVTTFSIDVVYHDGNLVGVTLLGTITVTADNGGSFPVSWSVPTGRQLAVRISASSANSPKNIICGLQLAGTVA